VDNADNSDSKNFRPKILFWKKIFFFSLFVLFFIYSLLYQEQSLFAAVPPEKPFPGEIFFPPPKNAAETCFRPASGAGPNSNDSECKALRFLKNRQSPFFQKYTSLGLPSAMPSRFPLTANPHERPGFSLLLQVADFDSRADLKADLTRSTNKPERNEIHGLAGNGDSLGVILSPWLTGSELKLVSAASKNIFRLDRIRRGQAYVVLVKDGKLSAFEYEIDNDNKLVVTRSGQGFSVAVEKIACEITLHRVQGRIKSNLFAAMAESGEKPLLAAELADIFAWEINFIRDLRVGDAYTLLVEKRYRNGEFKGYGKIPAACFINQGVTYEAFLFTDEAGISHYYNGKGESLRRAFLKAPLAFNRISSGYSSRRLHPVSRIWRAHPAVDYAAPHGTPVKAVGKGTVACTGYDKDAGNFVKISHMNRYETIYMHLSAFAKGLSTGSAVRQGQVIGFVGQTGSATGPHLDFRMKKNGSYVNPLKEASPRARPVTDSELARFMAVQANFRAFLEEKRELAEYSRSVSF
jgi:murein DD-endopeptidase MepM/ murein hydrolase activator NlpD